MIKISERKFKLDNFEGPLDLLLHLIKTKKLDILELSLVEVADQFVDYVNTAHLQDNLNLDEASEYMLLASQLIDLKAKYMLKTDIFLEPDDYEAETENLLERLINYEKYKNLTFKLEKLCDSTFGYEKIVDDFENFIENDSDRILKLVSRGSKDLERALHNVLFHYQLLDVKPIKIQLRKITVEQRTKEIIAQLKQDNDTTFISLLGEVPNSYFVAITLLVILELTSRHIIKLIQTDDLSDIEIRILNDENNKMNWGDQYAN